MPSLKNILLEMDVVLDRLIENAERLHELSKQEIVEDEVVALQKAQNEMLTQLTNLDSKRASIPHSPEAEIPLRAKIDEKIDIFQELNDRFIDNLSSTRGLLHFEQDKIRKGTKKSI